MSYDHEHPLYTAAERLMERGLPRKRTNNLLRLFKRESLPLPVDFQIRLEEEGFVIPKY